MTRFFIITFFLSLFDQVCCSQSQAVSVDYLCKINSIRIDSDKKIPLKRVIYFADTTYNEEDSIAKNDILNRLSFEIHKNIRAFAECSYAVINDNNSSAGITVHTPDTIKYCDNKWTSITQSKITDIPAKNVLIEETKEHKTILGYSCEKFLVKDIMSGEKYFVWANRTLPKTLNPMPGLNGFKYGILEVQEINDARSTIAIRITKLK
jgi:hypothetical protein